MDNIIKNIYKKYEKSISKRIVTFPLVFTETIAMDVKHWSDDPKTWFLCIIDNVTSYSALCVVR